MHQMKSGTAAILTHEYEDEFSTNCIRHPYGLDLRFLISVQSILVGKFGTVKIFKITKRGQRSASLFMNAGVIDCV